MARIRKPTAKIILRKKKLASGEYPVCLRITFDRQSKYVVLKDDKGKGITCTENKWNAEDGRFKRNREMNRLLEEYEKRAENALKSLEHSDFTFHAFNQKFFRRHERTKVEKFMFDLIHKFEARDQLGTADVYRNTRARLMEYDASVTFHDIDKQFLEAFETHLRGNNAATSVSIYLRTLRAVYNKAIDQSLVPPDLYPFSRFKIRSGNPVQRALYKPEMIAMMEHRDKLPKGSRAWHSLNYFIFSYLTRGANLQDMARLTWDNIQGDKLVYIRRKTRNTKQTPDPTIIKIEQPIAEILSHYSGNQPFIFPILQEGLTEKTIRYRIKGRLKTINKDLQSVAAEIGISGKIVFYMARHTYASVLKHEGVSIGVISESLGHSSESTTRHYLSKFEQSEIDKTFDHLL